MWCVYFLKASKDEGLVARGTNFQPYSFQYPVEGEGLKMVLITNHGYRMKPPLKSLNYGVQRASWL